MSSKQRPIAGEAPGNDQRPVRAGLVLVLLCAAQFMVILDGSIVAVALPVIGADLQVSGPALAWVVNAYLIPFGGLLLFAGKLGDVLGPRRVLLTGLAVFTLASTGCALAPDAGVLIAMRAVQGVGGALASAVVLGIIVTLFRGASERRRALAVFAFVGAAGSSVGLIAGGLLTQLVGWPWIFLINLPIGAVAFAGVRAAVPALPATRGRIDVGGAILVTGGLALSVAVLLNTVASTPVVVALAAIAAAALLGFALHEARTREPLLPLRLLATRTVGLGNLVQGLMVAGLFGFQFLGVLYLQQLLGYDALRAGLAYLPVPLVITSVSLGVTARVVARFGSRPVLATGTALVTVGLALLTRLSGVDEYLTRFLPAALLIGVGFGLAAPALAETAVASAPARHAGVASGLFNTTQQVGGALGLAILTRVAASGGPKAFATLGGYHVAFIVAAGLSGMAFALSLLTVTRARS